MAGTGAATARDRPRWRRWMRRVLLGLLSLVALLGLLLVYARLAWMAPEPELAGTPAILSERIREDDGGLELGDCRLERREGIRTLLLRGDPFSAGFANGRLTSDLIAEQRDQFFGMVHRLVPGWWALTGLKLLVLYQNRNLPDHVLPRRRLELLGIARGGPHIAPGTASDYHMTLNLHAAHDISHMVEDSPLLGCTAFVAGGEHTVDGHLLVGRNFDFEGCPSFDVNRIVMLVEPEDGIPFISVSWAGFAGVVTGLNREGVAVFIHGAKSDTSPGEGTPASLLGRRILEGARDLSEALAIVERTPIICTDMFLLASRKDGRCVVAERSRDRFAVRECGPLEAIANHLKTPPFVDDEANRAYRKSGTTVPREERMAELISERSGRLDPATGVAILRDRRGVGGKDLGLGNRRSINPLIATHSVIVDVTEGILWVSSPPHQLGAYVAFDAGDFSRRMPERTIPADPLLAEGGVGRHLEVRRLVAAGRRMLEDGLAGAAETAALKAIRLDGSSFSGPDLLGRALLAQGFPREAIPAFERALEAEPPFQETREEIEALLEEARRKAP